MAEHEFSDFAVECKSCKQMVTVKAIKCTHCGVDYPGDRDGSLSAYITERESRKEAAPTVIQSYGHDSSDKPDKTPYPEAIDCVSCGETVSKYALTCPHCGCNYANREWDISIRAAVIAVLIILVIVGLYVLVTR